MALLASYTALTLADRAWKNRGRAAVAWVLGGGFAMGTGIWAMHFLGMLAFQLPIPISYDLSLTIASWILPVSVCSIAMWQLTLPVVKQSHLGLAAALLGASILQMHYLGMDAMLMDPPIQWNWSLVLLSAVIALGASQLSLWIAVYLRNTAESHFHLIRFGAAAVMAVAVVGMHYTGMAAANFPTGSLCLASRSSLSTGSLSALVILGAGLILVIALLTAVFDARLEARNAILAAAQRNWHESRDMLEREQAARAEVERLSQQKDQFLALLSHELRTPLQAVMGWIQILKLKRDPVTLDRGLETIERNARLQAGLIDDLLDMSRISAGKIRLDLAPVDLVEIVHLACQTATPAADKKKLVLNVRPTDSSAWVMGDAQRLQQILDNLLSNAIKFTPERGHIDVRLQVYPGQVSVQVQDNGEGIGPDFLPHVFDLFRQADASTARQHQGLGLGLAIAHQLVHLHGGTIAAQSNGLGTGATFTVSLPRAPAPLQPVDKPSGLMPVDLGQQHLRRLRVLVVDDQIDGRQVVEELLRQWGADVIGVGSAEEALDVLMATQIDLVISDIGMPVIDGYEFIRRLRSSPLNSRLRSVAMTAFTHADDRNRALREGYDEFVPKPLEALHLLQVIFKLLPSWRS